MKTFALLIIAFLILAPVAQAGDLSKNFNRSEFVCKCCGAARIDPELVYRLEVLRRFFNQPIIITSGYRCIKHNGEVCGARYSRHLYGEAADIKIKGVPPEEVGRVAREICGFGFVKIYDTWIHVDVRKGGE